MMFKRIIFALFALSLTIFMGVYYGYPQVLVKPLLDINRQLSGLTERVIQLGPHQVHYLEGGQGETLVLLHGIFAEKDHWVDAARHLTGKYHVIVPDLPGFGASGRFADQSYDYATQAQRLTELLDALKIPKAHLAGNSMGGTLVAEWAILHPERVASLAFIGAPHGIRSPQKSEADQLIEAGEIPLIANNDKEFETLLNRLFSKRPFLPYPIWHQANQRALTDAASNRHIWQQQLKDRFRLQDRLANLSRSLPVLTLWGADDRIFNVSGAEVLQAKLPQSTLVVLPGVGHLPMMEAPAETARQYIEFLKRI